MMKIIDFSRNYYLARDLSDHLILRCYINSSKKNYGANVSALEFSGMNKLKNEQKMNRFTTGGHFFGTFS